MAKDTVGAGKVGASWWGAASKNHRNGNTVGSSPHTVLGPGRPGRVGKLLFEDIVLEGPGGAGAERATGRCDKRRNIGWLHLRVEMGKRSMAWVRRVAVRIIESVTGIRLFQSR